MDMTSLTAALESLKIVAGVARATAGAALDHQMKDRLIEIQQGILDVQMQLGDVTAERLELLNQVAELRRKVGDFEAAKAALDGYELCEVAPGEFLYRARESYGHSVAHYACPACYGSGRVSVLREQRQQGGHVAQFWCYAPGCTFTAHVRLSTP